MANYADVILRIYGDNSNTILDELLEMKNHKINIGDFVKKIKESFEDPKDLKTINDFMENGDKRFSFIVSDDFDGYLELEGQSAWCEPHESICMLERLYNVKIYYLVYESSNNIYETNDIEGDVFGDEFKYALDSNNHYGRIGEDALICEAEEYYKIDFPSIDSLLYTIINGSDPHKDDDEYFYLQKLERVE